MFWTGLSCSLTSQLPWVSPRVPAGEFVNLTNVSSALVVYYRTPDQKVKKKPNSRKLKKILYNWRNFHELQNRYVSRTKLKGNVTTTQTTLSISQGLFQDYKKTFSDCLHNTLLPLRSFQGLSLSIFHNRTLKF